ncbi:hypothetical protein COCNU_07G015040 [Cocos nucifera]|uniref:Uncharacterized protein n=1 Tax=Cocos nucifera TaxID=13894 RepID=A0A8K0IGU9_COCNU|nr:hypothetical protein COCNU_07G015040 [Cocos nucifera]
MDRAESSGGRGPPAHRRQSLEVYHEVLRRLKDSGCPEALSPAFDDELWAHFKRLPAGCSIMTGKFDDGFICCLLDS